MVYVLTGDVDGAISMFKQGLQIIKDANDIPLHDDDLDRFRLDLAELLHMTERLALIFSSFIHFFFCIISSDPLPQKRRLEISQRNLKNLNCFASNHQTNRNL